MGIIEIIAVFGSSLAGAGTAFWLNYWHEQSKIKEKEILKSREFLSRLYTIIEVTFNYYLQNLYNKDPEVIWKDLPLYFSGLIPDETTLNVSEISFCARSDKHKDFLSNAFAYEVKVEKLNHLLKKHSKITEEIEEEIQNYLGSLGKTQKEVSVYDLDYEEILGTRKAKAYRYMCMQIINTIPEIYLDGMDIQKQHREVMKEFYEDEEIREFYFEIPEEEERKKIIKEKKNRFKKMNEKIAERI